jgi:hypothetical protein
MKKLLLITSCLLLAYSAYTQDKFNDLYESFSVNDRFSNMQNLIHYQGKNPDHAIVYFKLAEINNEYLRETNPLFMYPILKNYYSQAKIYYGLVNFKIDDRQVRNDRDYYGTIPKAEDHKKIEKDDVVNEVNRRLGELDEYFGYAESVHLNFTRCVSKYNSCLYFYRNVLERYPNYKDLFLKADDDLLEQLANMVADFDSSIVYFDAYKTACSQLPHLLKVNTYQIHPIVTYRLEGLTEADFEKEVVNLWDFKSWGENFLKLMDTDINTIRDGLFDVDQAMDQQIEQLIHRTAFENEIDYYRPEARFQNLIGKYDYSSICNDLFDYKNSKIEWLAATKQEVNDTSLHDNFYLIAKLRYYEDLAEEVKALNDELALLRQNISFEKIILYNHFFNEQYGGMDGLMRWCVLEKSRNDELLNSNLEHLVKFIQHDREKYFFSDRVVSFQNQLIPFGIQRTTALQTMIDTTLTTGFKVFNKRWKYLHGVQIDKNGKGKAFLAGFDQQDRGRWLVSPRDKVQGSSLLFDHKILDDSTCYLVGWTEIPGDSQLIKETFVVAYDWNGKEEKNVVLQKNAFPLHLEVDEINEQYLLITRSTFNDSLTDLPVLKVALYTFNDSLKWEKEIFTDAELIDVVNTNNNFLIVIKGKSMNYQAWSLNYSAENQIVSSLYLTREGEMKHIGTYHIDGRVDLTSCLKINDNTINYIGKDLTNEAVSNVFYLLTDELGQPKLCNREGVTYEIYTEKSR